MDKPHTCGKGLAERSALPARLSALAAAIADVLERHQRTLDLTHDNAWPNTPRTVSSRATTAILRRSSGDRRPHGRISGPSDGPPPC